jgi:hypothetical protein
MPKPPMMNGQRVTCCYCKRQLDPPQPEIPTALTWDHVKPESDGGWKRVPCCRRCNFLKDNLTPPDWFWFIGAHPGWWKHFTHPEQVRTAVREFRFAQARAGVRPYGRKEGHVPFMGSWRNDR